MLLCRGNKGAVGAFKVSKSCHNSRTKLWHVKLRIEKRFRNIIFVLLEALRSASVLQVLEQIDQETNEWLLYTSLVHAQARCNDSQLKDTVLILNTSLQNIALFKTPKRAELNIILSTKVVTNDNKLCRLVGGRFIVVLVLVNVATNLHTHTVQFLRQWFYILYNYSKHAIMKIVAMCWWQYYEQFVFSILCKTWTTTLLLFLLCLANAQFFWS